MVPSACEKLLRIRTSMPLTSHTAVCNTCARRYLHNALTALTPFCIHHSIGHYLLGRGARPHSNTTGACIRTIRVPSTAKSLWSISCTGQRVSDAVQSSSNRLAADVDGSSFFNDFAFAHLRCILCQSARNIPWMARSMLESVSFDASRSVYRSI